MMGFNGTYNLLSDAAVVIKWVEPWWQPHKKCGFKQQKVVKRGDLMRITQKTCIKMGIQESNEKNNGFKPEKIADWR